MYKQRTKMKKIRYILLCSASLGIVSSCGDPELPFETFDELQKGAFARFINDTPTGVFDFFDIANSSIDVQVEFYDENDGKNVASYDWTVEYIDNNNGIGSISEVAFMSIPASSFTTNPDTGLPTTSLTLGFQAGLDAMGITSAQINGGDAIRFHATVVKTDGSSFNDQNTGPNIVSSAAFKGAFTVTANIICPSGLEGTHTYSTVGWCGTVVTGTTTWVNEGSGQYSVADGDYSFGAYDACYGDGTYGSAGAFPEGDLLINDACGKLSWSGASQWGEIYQFNSVTVSGADVIFDWNNDCCGEAGVTTITREGGANWPALK